MGAPLGKSVLGGTDTGTYSKKRPISPNHLHESLQNHRFSAVHHRFINLVHTNWRVALVPFMALISIHPSTFQFTPQKGRGQGLIIWCYLPVLYLFRSPSAGQVAVWQGAFAHLGPSSP